MPTVCPSTAVIAPDLAAIVAAWHSMPKAVRAAVMALVKAASVLPEYSGPDKTDEIPAAGGGGR